MTVLQLLHCSVDSEVSANKQKWSEISVNPQRAGRAQGSTTRFFRRQNHRQSINQSINKN